MRSKVHISLEGLDGAGKSTARKSLVDHYTLTGREVAELTSPSRRPEGQYLRQNMLLLSTEEIERLIIEDLRDSEAAIPEDTEIAIWDRHIDSLYTSNRGSDLGRICLLAAGLTLPKKTFYLRLDSSTAYERAAPITDHDLDKEWLDYKFERYEELLRANPDRIIPIDANQPANVVLHEITEHLKEDL